MVLQLRIFILALLLPFLGQSQVMEQFSSDSLVGITSPLGIADLVFGLESDSPNILDSTSAAIGNNEGVATWNDLSSNNLDATNSNNGARPVWKSSGGPGGYPYLQFDGSNDSLRLDRTSLLSSSTDVTVFVVGNLGSSIVNNECLWSFSNNNTGLTSGARMRAITGADRAQFQAHIGTVVSANKTGVATSTWYLFTGYYDNSLSSSTYDDQAATTSSSSGNIGWGGATKHNIGFSAVHFGGSICAIYVYARALTSTEIAQVKNYLNKKYDLY
jgi:hypothetical protein